MSATILLQEKIYLPVSVREALQFDDNNPNVIDGYPVNVSRFDKKKATWLIIQAGIFYGWELFDFLQYHLNEDNERCFEFTDNEAKILIEAIEDILEAQEGEECRWVMRDPDKKEEFYKDIYEIKELLQDALERKVEYFEILA